MPLASIENPDYYEPLEKVLPEYPKALKEKGIVGKVVVSIWFYDGNVILVCVNSGPRELRPLVEKAVMKWKFKPVTLMGKQFCLTTGATFNFVP